MCVCVCVCVCVCTCVCVCVCVCVGALQRTRSSTPEHPLKPKRVVITHAVRYISSVWCVGLNVGDMGVYTYSQVAALAVGIHSDDHVFHCVVVLEYGFDLGKNGGSFASIRWCVQGDAQHWHLRLQDAACHHAHHRSNVAPVCVCVCVCVCVRVRVCVCVRA